MGNYIIFFSSGIETQNELFGSYLKVMNSEQKQGKKESKGKKINYVIKYVAVILQ